MILETLSIGVIQEAKFLWDEVCLLLSVLRLTRTDSGQHSTLSSKRFSSLEFVRFSWTELKHSQLRSNSKLLNKLMLWSGAFNENLQNRLIIIYFVHLILFIREVIRPLLMMHCREDRLYCDQCYKEQFVPRCAKCQDFITSVIFMMYWHLHLYQHQHCHHHHQQQLIDLSYS